GQRRAHRAVDVFELRIPVRVTVTLTRLAIALQAVAHAIEQGANQRATNPMALRPKLFCQPPDALARPAQRRLRIAATGWLDQSAEVAQQRRILRHRRLAATTAAPNPTPFLRRRQLPQAATNRTRRKPCRGGSRCDPTVSCRRCFGRRDNTPTALVEKRRYRRK